MIWFVWGLVVLVESWLIVGMSDCGGKDGDNASALAGLDATGPGPDAAADSPVWLPGVGFSTARSNPAVLSTGAAVFLAMAYFAPIAPENPPIAPDAARRPRNHGSPHRSAAAF